MKALHYIIPTVIFLLFFGNQGIKGQQSEDFFRAAEEEETGAHIGLPAPEIILESPSGEKIALSSLRGQVVLIDFWAAWCPPCRRENPSLVNTYRQYKDREFVNGTGFTIYSVSLDKKKESWIAAIEEDSLVWESHVSDLKGRQSAAAIEYEVASIPLNFLLDGNGIILAVGLRGSALEVRLKELLK
jgi:thiol-disulfide isomerase/thioredoxin